jgi:hypothetical protein
MTNDETQMHREAEQAVAVHDSSFVLRHSFVIRASSFVIPATTALLILQRRLFFL